MRSLIRICLLVSIPWVLIHACSNIIVSPGASVDSSSLLAYNADAGSLYGSLYHYPAADHAVTDMRDIYDWDSGRYLGQIKEAARTYNVVGNINEYGLSIGETTYGGIAALQSQPDAKIDYGSLIWVTLQRATNAREAIRTMGELMKTYGYASEGESFSIIDPHEAWVMEIIGKGSYELGAVWVAMKIPDGSVCAHANQARITTFPLHDPESCIYAEDTISFAKKIGLYPKDAADKDFSFSDVYDPVTFTGARFCEARVWSFFSSIMGEDWSQQYLDYAQGTNLTNRMPLFVQPQSKISLSDTMDYMRNHFEKTALDMSGQEFSDVGAAAEGVPVRAHPLTWTSSVNPDGSISSDSQNNYVHERPIATQQTGWNFVAQSRRWMPRELSGLLWFGVDDSATTVRFPIYGCSLKVPASFAGKGPQDGVVSPMMTFSLDSAFYVFNLLANWAYTRWSLIYPEVYQQILARETAFIEQVYRIDKEALQIYESKGAAAASEYVTAFAVAAGDSLTKEWFAYFGELFVKYRDGYLVTAEPSNTQCGCKAESSPYPQEWLDRIVKDTGSHYYIPPEASSIRDAQFKPRSKIELLQRR
jgi:dipeptidase